MPHYIVSQEINTQEPKEYRKRLVEAKSSAQAIAHCVATTITCVKASASDLIACGRDGITVEKAAE